MYGEVDLQGAKIHNGMNKVMLTHLKTKVRIVYYYREQYVRHANASSIVHPSSYSSLSLSLPLSMRGIALSPLLMHTNTLRDTGARLNEARRPYTLTCVCLDMLADAARPPPPSTPIAVVLRTAHGWCSSRNSLQLPYGPLNFNSPQH